jgi:hypothetical protein
MNLKIYPRRHCIETEIRRQYSKAISEYFSTSDDKNKIELENKIDLLHHALETLDFNYLRNRYEQLRENSTAEVSLLLDGQGSISININGEKIETTDKN